MKTETLRRKGRTYTAKLPERADIDELKEGDTVSACLGEAKVVEISYRGTDVNGCRYVGFFVAFGENNGRMSGSIKEGELIRTVALTGEFTSAELDAIEARMSEPLGIVPAARSKGGFCTARVNLHEVIARAPMTADGWVQLSVGRELRWVPATKLTEYESIYGFQIP